ncbi:hypothetical protein [Actinomadura sp. 6N118]|uniref:hypothetical protein n=1 Tax=Actinomadura sp. 6N118 TaxID=3375151 RepID=UPI0037ACE892
MLGSGTGEINGALGRLPLATPELTEQPRVRDLWTASLGIAVGCYVLFILFGGLLVMTHESVQTRYAAREIAPRLVVGIIAAVVSLPVLGGAIRLCNAVTWALFGQGIEPGRALRALVTMVGTPAAAGGGWIVLFLQLAALVMVVVVVATFIIRLIVTLLLIVSAPLALACHASPLTEGAAQLWWRVLGAVLAIEAGEGLSLIVALRVLSNSDGREAAGLGFGGRLVNILVVLCLLYVMIKIPVWAFRMAFQSRGHHTPMLVRLAMYAAASRGLRALTSGTGGGRGPGAGPAASPSRPQPGPAGGGGTSRLGQLAKAGVAAAGAAATGGVGAAATGGVAGAGAAARSGAAAGSSAARAQGLRRALSHGRLLRTPRTGGRPRWSAGSGEPGSASEAHLAAGRGGLPRWAAPGQRWTPPDPAWHRHVHRGRLAPDSDATRNQWGRPNPWTPPYAGPWDRPQPRRSQVTAGVWPAPSPPDPVRPWLPPR